MNARLLRSKMVLFGDTQGDLAEALDISQQRLSAKMNETNGAEFNQREIRIIRQRYNLTAEELSLIFFV